jgi:hypothetical protein
VIQGSRDRHGRGIRGPLGPAHLPIIRSRASVFGSWVIDAVDFVDDRLAEIELQTGVTGLVDAFDAVDIVIDDVPPAENLHDRPAAGEDDVIPLGRIEPIAGRRPARLIVHRRTVEQRGLDKPAREQVVREVVVRLAAELLGLEPGSLDPQYDDQP